MIDLEGITGFELGNVLEPVLMDKRKNNEVPLWLEGMDSSRYRFYVSIKIRHPLMRLSMDHPCLYTSFPKLRRGFGLRVCVLRDPSVRG